MPDNWFCESCGSLESRQRRSLLSVQVREGAGDRGHHSRAASAETLFCPARTGWTPAERRPGSPIIPTSISRFRRTLSVLGFTILIAAGLATVAGSVAALLAMLAPDAFQVTDAMRRLRWWPAR